MNPQSAKCDLRPVDLDHPIPGRDGLPSRRHRFRHIESLAFLVIFLDAHHLGRDTEHPVLNILKG
jgi:hypothetical protein